MFLAQNSYCQKRLGEAEMWPGGSILAVLFGASDLRTLGGTSVLPPDVLPPALFSGRRPPGPHQSLLELWTL